MMRCGGVAMKGIDGGVVLTVVTITSSGEGVQIVVTTMRRGEDKIGVGEDIELKKLENINRMLKRSMIPKGPI